MNVLFIQKQAFPYFGIMSIAGYLKRYGHTCNCLIDNLEPVHKHGDALLHADLIGISVLTPEHLWLLDVVQRIKHLAPDTPIVIGGVHAILYPDILGETGADMLCASEGELSLKKLLDSMSRAGDFNGLSSIEGLVYREGMQIIKNKISKLIQLFDWFEDRSVYYNRYTSLKHDEQKQFMSGRGCPYRCNFCSNVQLQDKYRGLGKYLRKKPVDLFIEEIEQTRTEYGARSIYFSDDCFLIDKEWTFAFLAQYRKHIKTSFMCVVRADQIDREIARELSQSGCHAISMGVETGNEQIRRNILNKNITNTNLQYAADCLREYNIRIQTSNMFGIPGETLDDALQTVRLNIELGASFAFAAMLMPFPGTGIEKIALELGWLKKPLSLETLPQSFFSGSVFKVPQLPVLQNVKSVAHWCIVYPKMYRFFAKLVTIRFKPLFWLLDKMGIFFRYKGERMLSLREAIRMFWRFRRSR